MEKNIVRVMNSTFKKRSYDEGKRRNIYIGYINDRMGKDERFCSNGQTARDLLNYVLRILDPFIIKIRPAKLCVKRDSECYTIGVWDLIIAKYYIY